MKKDRNLINYLTQAIAFKGGPQGVENLNSLVELYCDLWSKELHDKGISSKDIFERRPHFISFIKTHYQTSDKRDF